MEFEADPAVKDNFGVQVQGKFRKFLESFGTGLQDDGSQGKHYMEQLSDIKNNDRSTLFIDYDHLKAQDPDLAMCIEGDYYRLEPYLRQALQDVMRRIQAMSMTSAEEKERDYWVGFFNLPVTRKLRELRTEKVGKLLTVTGTVTRVGDVRPELWSGTFQCMDCGKIAARVEQDFRYTEPSVCTNPACTNRRHWLLDFDSSVFIDFQRVRIQENTSEIPAGSMPRSIDVILRHEMVDKAKAGDKCLFTGTLIVVPDVAQLSTPGEQAEVTTSGGDRSAYSSQGVTGLRRLGVRDLHYRLAFLACHVIQADARGTRLRSSDDEELLLTPEEQDEVDAMKSNRNIYQKLVDSFCPHIHGHEDVKRGLLLQLLGGVHKTTPEGMSLRGDLNVCITGDPGTAKSQFLKYVSSFASRAVYTSGKSSSAAGLTASVVKDTETGEFTIEAGALMLADNGICCIDEFDKMDIRDQVAIHEAMEQQTISITKAGIQATLNARTSILAAANPINGRYDPSRPLRDNIEMSAPIMSRFDLFYILLDECNEASDYNVARHLVFLHQHHQPPALPEYTPDKIQRYIRCMRRMNPKISLDAKRELVERYKALRLDDMAAVSQTSYRITIRQLESLTRLSEALARLHAHQIVTRKHVVEAARLLQRSIRTVESEPVVMDDDDTRAPDHPPPSAADEAAGTNAMDTGDADAGAADSAPAKAASGGGAGTDKITLDYGEYRRMSNLLCMHLRKIEEHAPTHPQHEQVLHGLGKHALVEWYLASSDIGSEEELIKRSRVVRSVIRRLVETDHVLIEIGPNPESPDEQLLAVHPNYVIPSIDE